MAKTTIKDMEILIHDLADLVQAMIPHMDSVAGEKAKKFLANVDVVLPGPGR